MHSFYPSQTVVAPKATKHPSCLIMPSKKSHLNPFKMFVVNFKALLGQAPTYISDHGPGSLRVDRLFCFIFNSPPR